MVHNHTRAADGGSFGEDDFEAMRDHPDMEEIWAVDWRCDHRVKVVGDISKMTYDKAYPLGLGFIEDEDYKHAVMRALDAEGYIDYSRTRV